MHNFSKNFSYLLSINNLKQVDFSKKIGIERTTITNYKNGISTPDYDKTIKIAKYFGISIDDLLIGDIQKKKPHLNTHLNTHLNAEKSKEISAIQATQGIPLIPIEAMAGFGVAESVQVFENQITERYVIPEFTGKVDFFIRVYGSSMYPKYNSGDIVACKRIENLSFVQWNKTYVLDTTQGALVKRLIKSSIDGNIVCRSDNQAYSDFELNIDNDINAIALIVGVIRFE